MIFKIIKDLFIRVNVIVNNTVGIVVKIATIAQSVNVKIVNGLKNLKVKLK